MRKSIAQRFEEMNRLYHFTSFKAACSIIESGKLRFGESFRMNDLIDRLFEYVKLESPENILHKKILILLRFCVNL